MREAEAMRLLGATAQDDLKTIKKKFRAKMKLAHPDARAMQAVHDMSQAQKLNEAYELLKNRHSKKHTHGKHKEKESTWEDFFSFYAYDEPEWEAPEWEFTSIEHEAAYQERVVYRYEWYDSASGQYRRVTTGKYLWNPDCEEFSLLLFSLNQLAQQLLSNEEEQNNRSVSSRERDFAYTVNRQQFQLRLFHYLAVQYIQPQYALQKLENRFGQTGRIARYIGLRHRLVNRRKGLQHIYWNKSTWEITCIHKPFGKTSSMYVCKTEWKRGIFPLSRIRYIMSFFHC